MAVAYDAVGPSSAGVGGPFNSASPVTWTHTSVGTSGLAGLVVVTLGASNTTQNAYTLSATWGGVAMSSLGKVYTDNSTAGFVQLFGIINPPSGAQTISVTPSGAPYSITAGSVSYTGVGSFGTAVTAYGSSTSAAVSVTGTSTSNMIAAGVGAGSGLTASTGVTSRWVDNYSGSTGAGNAAQGDHAGATTATSLTWTISASDFWGAIGVEVKAATAVATVLAPPRRAARQAVQRAANY